MNACGDGCGYCGRCDSGGPPDASCEDCHAGVWLARFDVAPFLCHDCFDARERWATEQEARIFARRMLKAILPVFVRTDVA